MTDSQTADTQAPAAAPAKSISATEMELYKAWENSDAVKANVNSNAAPYTIMMPPPNVTGSLHVGHALTMSLQDILIRWRRMQGRDALWQPGTDHAGIATQLMVERLLHKEGTNSKEIGREAFLKRVWQWKEESGGTITRQLRRLGASVDWSRERFTMDEGLSKAVTEAFVSLHKDGLIYRDRRLVNWDPKFQSALSDLEVENKETKGSLWYLRYPLTADPSRHIVVATTRPETLLGDMAVAVNPSDERYASLIGQTITLPLVGRQIPIVGDEHSDPEKGSGAVKITPAHDFNDFEVGKRHNLAMPSVLDHTAKIWLDEIKADLRDIDGIASVAFVQSLAGKDRFEARALMVAELERLELLEKIEPHTNQVPHAERGGEIVEPRLTLQWYCDAAKMAIPAIAAVRDGRTQFVPKQWENTYFAWMENLQPWCISRQLWWGHRIPAWYGPDGTAFVAHDAATAQAQATAHYGKAVALTQDEDVLDTWFSSALWPFSTLGWPEKTPELNRYYPGDVLVTGFDIIFFWVARMMMMGMHFMKDVPFRTVYIHGLVRDEKGQKMSKTKGNTIDPITLMEEYGTDALRWTIASLAGPGRNINLGPTRVELGRNFITKLRNAANFWSRNGVTGQLAFDSSTLTLPLCRWIVLEANTTIQTATKALENYRFDDYADVLQHFVRGCFCDWFIELAKPAMTTSDADEVRATASYILGLCLRLLHPVAPYVTQELWSQFGYNSKTELISATWPEPVAISGAESAKADVDWLIELVTGLRAIRAEMNVPATAPISVLMKDASAQTLDRAKLWGDFVARLARAEKLEALNGTSPKDCAQMVVGETTFIVPLAGVIDLDAERARLERKIAKAEAAVQQIVSRLDNADFVKRAPQEVIDEAKQNLADGQNEIARLRAALQLIAA